jgi:uncharacterized protein (DUF2267 family)
MTWPSSATRNPCGRHQRRRTEHVTRSALPSAERRRTVLSGDRVAQRAGADTAKATHEARSVVEVVGEATQGGVLDKIRQSLDDELAKVLFAGSTGSVG